jgi:cobaltochelatase CobS
MDNTISNLVDKLSQHRRDVLTDEETRAALELSSSSDLRTLCRIVYEDHPAGTTWVASARKAQMVDGLVGKLYEDPSSNPTGTGQLSLQPAPAARSSQDPADLFFAGLRGLMDQNSQPAGIDRDAVLELVREELAKRPPHQVTVKVADRQTVNVGRQHPRFELLVKAASIEQTVALVGPAGSGKTTAARALAKAYGQAFTCISVGAQTSQSDIFGFIDAHGNHQRDTVARAIRDGHVLLLDEYDTCHPGVSKQMNGILDGGTSTIEFPSGKLEKHPDFKVIVAMNTTGRGASRDYVGGRQQDASTLDRMAWIEWGYDTDFEADIASQQGATPEETADWIATVEKLRDRIDETGLRLTIGTRAKIKGCKALANGFTKDEALELFVFNALGPDEAAALRAAL